MMNRFTYKIWFFIFNVLAVVFLDYKVEAVSHKRMKILFFMRHPNDILGRAFIHDQIFGLKKRGQCIGQSLKKTNPGIQSIVNIGVIR